MELQLNGLEAPDELQINTVTQKATQQNSEKSKPTCHHFKKPGHYRNQCRQLKREKDQARNNTNSADNINNNNIGPTSSDCNNNIPNNTKPNNKNIQKDRRATPIYPSYETCGRTNHSTENCCFEANAANRPPLRKRGLEVRNRAQQSCPKQLRWQSPSNVQPRL